MKDSIYIFDLLDSMKYEGFLPTLTYLGHYILFQPVYNLFTVFITLPFLLVIGIFIGITIQKRKNAYERHDNNHNNKHNIRSLLRYLTR